MAWKPLAWKNSGRSKAEAAKPKADDPEPEDDDDDDPILDPDEGSDLRDEDEDDEPEEGAKKKSEEPATPAAGGSNLPAASADPAARLAALEAENAELRSRLGEQTLPNAQKAARATAVRLFGQGTPQLTEAKKLVAACETVADAERITASWELALSATSLAANAGARQTARAATVVDPDATTTAKAKDAVARTRPRSVKPGNKEE